MLSFNLTGGDLMRRFLWQGLVLGVFLRSTLALPCTATHLSGQGTHVLGQNVGWYTKFKGAFVVNKRHVSKVGELFSSSGTPATWTSKYGSLSLLAMGREFPISGINETGLVVQGLQFHDKYPDDPTIPVVHSFQWIQYQLDLSSNLQEAISNAEMVRPVGKSLQLHYFVCDAAGACAIFEFIDGKLEIYAGSRLPESVTTNSPYLASLDALSMCPGNSCSQTNDSLMRFIRAAKAVKAYGGSGDHVSYALYALSLARQEFPLTLWNILFERAESGSRVYFRPVGSPFLNTIRVSAFDYACKSQTKVFGFDSVPTGDVTDNFHDYTKQFQENFARQPGLALPPETSQRVIDYPETKTTCLE